MQNFDHTEGEELRAALVAPGGIHLSEVNTEAVVILADSRAWTMPVEATDHLLRLARGETVEREVAVFGPHEMPLAEWWLAEGLTSAHLAETGC